MVCFGKRMAKVLRSSSETVKYEDILEQKLLDFGKNLATKDDIAEIKNLFNKLNEKIEYQDRKIAALEKDSSDYEDWITSLENSVNEMYDEVSKLLDKNAVLSSSLDFLKQKSDSQEQYSRRACLRISGIEKSESESASDCVKKVVDIFTNTNVNLSAEDIDRAHRVGKDKKTMIVKFFSFGKRTKVYKERKTVEQIKVHLDLTKQRLKLLDSAKELITADSPVEFVFADINCNVVARLKSGRYKFFDNIDSFKEKILNDS